MWDLTVPGNNDHDFYVSVAATAVLVHNDSFRVALKAAISIGSEMSGSSVHLGRLVSRSSGMSNCRAPGERKSDGCLRTVTWRM